MGQVRGLLLLLGVRRDFPVMFGVFGQDNPHESVTPKQKIVVIMTKDKNNILTLLFIINGSLFISICFIFYFGEMVEIFIQYFFPATSVGRLTPLKTTSIFSKLVIPTLLEAYKKFLSLTYPYPRDASSAWGLS